MIYADIIVDISHERVLIREILAEDAAKGK